MAESREAEDVDWYTADIRGIIPLDQFKVSKNVQRLIRKQKYECRVDTAFRSVLEACANRESTWINDIILNSYQLLHQMGYAHSVEIYVEDELAGGLYGVSIGKAFFGESMFHSITDASKVAFYHFIKHLEQSGFYFVDAQMHTNHLVSLGAREISREKYLNLLEKAVSENEGNTWEKVSE